MVIQPRFPVERQLLHAPGLCRRVRQSHPGTDLFARFQAKIPAVLVPGRIGGRVRFLNEERAGPDHDVRTDDIFHSIQDARMADQVVEPRRMRIAVRTPFHVGVGDGAAKLAFKALQSRKAGGGFFRVERRDRKQEAVVAEGRHLFPRKHFHWFLPIGPLRPAGSISVPDPAETPAGGLSGTSAGRSRRCKRRHRRIPRSRARSCQDRRASARGT